MSPTAEAEVEIVNQLGLHARPAAHFVRTSAKFESEIYVVRDGVEVNGKSIMGVMMLAAEQGSTLRIRAEGDDAEAAVRALVDLVERGFDEDDEGRPVSNGARSAE
ncbi:MAG: HPr family phosphocarrier protein [Gemmatimonadota bacterium]|nr:HPr family phosphocarrier protein [Gemmatimonadota bacterium]